MPSALLETRWKIFKAKQKHENVTSLMPMATAISTQMAFRAIIQS